MSPSLPAYSSYTTSRSASRSRCSTTCFAVCAAMRPAFAGVASSFCSEAPSHITTSASMPSAAAA